MSAPTVDISNLDTANLTIEDNREAFVQKVKISCRNMFSVAQAALSKHPQLKKVAILEHAPRFDTQDIDPAGLKPELAKLANATFSQLWHSSSFKHKITIGKHSLDCPDELIAARYSTRSLKKYQSAQAYFF